MKKLLLFFSLIFLGSNLSAQYAEDFESYGCNRNNAFNNCHAFAATSLSTNNAINGCSVRSGQLNNSDGVGTGVSALYRTPALNFTSATNIQFNHYTTSGSSNPMLTIVAIDPANSSEIVVAGPSAVPTSSTASSIASSLNGIYRIEFRVVGNGGNSRYILDDISIDGAELAETPGEDGCEVIFPEVPAEDLPSMSQWLTIIFGLIIFGFSTFVLYNMNDQKRKLG